MSPQTLQCRLGTPIFASSEIGFPIGCCILKDDIEGAVELVDRLFAGDLKSLVKSPFTICSSSLDKRLNVW